MNPSENTFSGWSENYLACNEQNTEILPNQDISRGKVILAKYLRLAENEENDE